MPLLLEKGFTPLKTLTKGKSIRTEQSQLHLQILQVCTCLNVNLFLSNVDFKKGW